VGETGVAEVTVDEVCVVACADLFRGDGEILASPFGSVPTIGARLARATFEPELLVSDGEALLVANPLPLGGGPEDKVVEGWMPFRTVFDLVWAGRRHAILGASQVDPFGNSNISCIGDWAKPKVQLIGVRGAPGNSINHPVSYWIPDHSPRVFVERVDMVSGVGYDRGVGTVDVRGVVTNLCVLDFETPDRSTRVRSLHPGITADHVQEQTGFDVAIPDDCPNSRLPTNEELRLIREVFDPTGLRKREVKA
jgi:acyl CoA:acetate/3-ketoacid CoA transferase beta subunit